MEEMRNAQLLAPSASLLRVSLEIQQQRGVSMATYTGLSVYFCIPKYTLGSPRSPVASVCSLDAHRLPALAGQSWAPRPVGAEGARGSPAAPRPLQPCLQAAMGQCPPSPAGARGCAAPRGCAACACRGQPGGLCGTRGSGGRWRGRAVELLPWELPLPQPAVRFAAVPPQLSAGFPAARAGSRCLGPCSQPSPRPRPRRRNCHVRSRWCHLQ